MQKRLILFLFLCFQQIGNAQLIPFGLDVTPEGKIEFSLGEQNYNGNLDEPARISCDGERTHVWDWRNVKYMYLTIFSFPESPSIPMNQPLFELSDTVIYDFKSMGAIFISPHFDSVRTFVIGTQTRDPNRFYDDIMGLGLSDSIGNNLKKKLTKYTHQYSGKYVPDEIRDSLKDELSEIDTIIDGQEIFKYSADCLVFYNYQDTQLTSVVAYNSHGSVDFDSLRYDGAGNMIYFLKESIGGTRDEYFMEYDQNNRLTTLSHQYSFTGNSEEDSFKTREIIEVSKFDYNEAGIINCRSTLQGDGTWLSCHFERETPLKTE